MRLIRALVLALVSAVVAFVATYIVVVRPRLRAWGFDAAEVELPLPGDELVTDPNTIETRGVTIEAPVTKVWPYLVQMGFGRAGWYSYEVLDSKVKGAETVVPELQSLEEGDVMPISPGGGGFVVKTLDFEQALVLYTDAAIARAQAEEAVAEADPESPMAGMKMSSSSFPEFAASWAFYLKATDDGKTRLIERFRARTPGSGPATAVLGEVMGTGIVLMTRKQMLGIKERAERAEMAAMEQPIDSAAADVSAETLPAI
jgi:hypothetical protein